LELRLALVRSGGSVGRGRFVFAFSRRLRKAFAMKPNHPYEPSRRMKLAVWSGCLFLSWAIALGIAFEIWG
jgi:hypothetical protein